MGSAGHPKTVTFEKSLIVPEMLPIRNLIEQSVRIYINTKCLYKFILNMLVRGHIMDEFPLMQRCTT